MATVMTLFNQSFRRTYLQALSQIKGTMSTGDVAVPGQRLATADGKITAGKGVYVRDGCIFASIFGKWRILQDVVEVTRATKTVASAQVLRLSDVVICRVVKIMPRQVMVDILCVGETVLREAFPGTIRLEDVRKQDIDKLVMEEVFLPAKPGLGVVHQPTE